jgi:hypothetical protein
VDSLTKLREGVRVMSSGVQRGMARVGYVILAVWIIAWVTALLDGGTGKDSLMWDLRTMIVVPCFVWVAWKAVLWISEGFTT